MLSCGQRAGDALTGSCEVDPDNGLRGWCSATVAQGEALEVVLSTPSQPDVVISSGQTGTEQRFPWYFAPEDSEVRYTIRVADAAGRDAADLPAPVEGTMRTLSMPRELNVGADVTGVAPFERALGIGPCRAFPSAVVYGPSGEILWWQRIPGVGQVDLTNISLTEDNTILAVFDDETDGRMDHVMEFDFSGEVVGHWSTADGLELATHHDATKHDGVVYALFKRSVQVAGREVLLDGIYALTPTGWDIVWELEDYVQLDESSQTDFSHANLIEANDEGVWVSFRSMSTVAFLPFTDDGLGAPSVSIPGGDDYFGDGLSWLPLAEEHRTFRLQHDAQMLQGGQWLVFDNGEGPAASRVTLMGTDATSVWIDASWRLPSWCNFQGGSRMTPDGHVLATCAPGRRVFGFEQGSPAPVYDLRLSCESGSSRYVARLMPFAW